MAANSGLEVCQGINNGTVIFEPSTGLRIEVGGTEDHAIVADILVDALNARWLTVDLDEVLPMHVIQ